MGESHSNVKRSTCVWEAGPADRRLCLVIIMPQPSRTRRRSKFPEEMPSFATREVVGVTRKNGRVTKKRVVERTPYDTRPSALSLPEINTLLPITEDSAPGSQASVSQPSNKQDKSKRPSPSNTSRSVSVSVTRFCHVVAYSPASRP